jgi:uncharacterized membrane protein YkvA (DUF1232 family)
MTATWRARVAALKRETLALYLAARHPRTPWYARILVAAIAAYALSPIDLIPDFIPVLGLVDELVLLPLAIALALQLIPHDVIVECRTRAAEAFATGRPVSRSAALAIMLVWIGLLALGACMLLRLMA